MIKLSQSMQDHLDKADSYSESSTIVRGLHHLFSVTKRTGDNRISFAADIRSVSMELDVSCKDSERSRKQLKDTVTKQQRALSEQENQASKIKSKVDVLAEEIRDLRIQQQLSRHQGYVTPEPERKFGIFQKKRSQEEIENKLENLSHEYNRRSHECSQNRQNFIDVELPGILEQLKEVDDECDAAVRATLINYASHFEKVLFADASLISPLESKDLNLKNILSKINRRNDFSKEMESFISSAPLAKKSSSKLIEIPRIDFKAKQQELDEDVKPMPKAIMSSSQPGHKVFQTNIDQLLDEENAEIPSVLQQCFEVIERNGLNWSDLYNSSPNPGKLKQLENFFESASAERTNLLNQKQWRNDINTVSSMVIYFLEQLPEPLLTDEFFQRFMDAGAIRDPQARLLSIHQAINELPDANYIVLRHLAAHLNFVAKNAKGCNSRKLASLFASPLMMPVNASDKERGNDAQKAQARAIETIIDGFGSIFEA